MLRLVDFTVGLSCYLVIFAGLSSIVGRWLRRLTHSFRPAQTRALMIVVFAVAWLAPNIINFSFPLVSPYYYLTDPVHTLSRLIDGVVQSKNLLAVLVASACFVLLLNARAMWRGLFEVVFRREYGEDFENLVPQPAVVPQRAFFIINARTGRRLGSHLCQLKLSPFVVLYLSQRPTYCDK